MDNGCGAAPEARLSGPVTMVRRAENTAVVCSGRRRGWSSRPVQEELLFATATKNATEFFLVKQRAQSGAVTRSGTRSPGLNRN